MSIYKKYLICICKLLTEKKNKQEKGHENKTHSGIHQGKVANASYNRIQRNIATQTNKEDSMNLSKIIIL